eukprot:scaffold49128_cov78-Cyclotella_meneghiniana.AAC.6
MMSQNHLTPKSKKRIGLISPQQLIADVIMTMGGHKCTSPPQRIAVGKSNKGEAKLMSFSCLVGLCQWPMAHCPFTHYPFLLAYDTTISS